MKSKIIVFTFFFIFLFFFSIFLSGFLPFIAEYKMAINSNLIMEFTKDIILHPIKNIKEMHAEQNPLLYLSMAAALFLFIYILYKSRNKNYENVGERYGVQGSSRWAKKHEIFKVPDQITVIPSKDMYGELKKTLNK
ncbi:hypothetical protein M3175_20470 [Robertmurraya korlensis]|uniref:hypothetical protein n=1 Tax=Robertmurraya korlensis TaxID=519977 RepID=UPI00203E3CC0|nr:hypothetical protein [Robertmurraya korlensis]MCM3603117.1 hypothetical protein [Robertmurraya korlensis]